MEKPNLEKFLQEVEYSIDFKPRNNHPGRWPSSGNFGSSFSFEKFENLSSHPDFRRIDHFATARNLLANEPLVRVYKQTSSINVLMVADLSLSMEFGFSEPKIWQIAKLATLFGYTTYQFGDRFGFIGCDSKARESLFYPPVKSKTIGLEIGEALLDFDNPSASAEGLLEAQYFLPTKKCLVIFVSDFYFSLDFLEKFVTEIESHEILPVMLRREIERHWPSGILALSSFRDIETGKKRPMFLSRRSIKKFNTKAKQDEKLIKNLFLTTGMSSSFLTVGDQIIKDVLLWMKGEET